MDRFSKALDVRGCNAGHRYSAILSRVDRMLSQISSSSEDGSQDGQPPLQAAPSVVGSDRYRRTYQSRTVSMTREKILDALIPVM